MTSAKVIKISPKTSGPPRPLGKHGTNLWRAVNSEFCIEDSGGAEMLLQACTMLDRAEDLRAEVEKDGAVIRTRGVLRDHPALKHEIAARAFVVRTLSRLGLEFEPLKSVGRPALGFGWNGEKD